jgi:hypothetical protein
MNTADPILKIIIVHEDSVAGLRATDLLKRLAARLGDKSGMDISPWEFCNRAWQFEWLQNPNLSAQALAEAVAADMIIISAGGHAELPVCVRKWIESVLARKQGGPAALVALLDGRRAAHTAALNPGPYLRQLAAQNGVDFYCNLNQWPLNFGFYIESVISRFEDGSVILAEAPVASSDQQA